MIVCGLVPMEGMEVGMEVPQEACDCRCVLAGVGDHTSSTLGRAGCFFKAGLPEPPPPSAGKSESVRLAELGVSAVLLAGAAACGAEAFGAELLVGAEACGAELLAGADACGADDVLQHHWEVDHLAPLQ